MPRTHRFNATEQKIVDLADRVIANPAATPAELTGAMRSLERVISKAARRAKNKPPAADPVDTLVQQMEAAKPAVQPVAAAAANLLQAVQDIADGKMPAAQLVPEPPAQKCWNCDQSGQPTWDDRVLCPTHLAAAAADLARQNAVASLARQQGQQDWAVDFATQRQLNTSDFEKSRALWAEQDQAAADRQTEERAERDRAEAQYHAARARWIQDGGRL